MAIVQASDIDSGANGQVSYRISAQDTTNPFSIVASGSSAVVQMARDGILDFESRVNWEVEIEAFDGGQPTPRTATFTIEIQVTDVNEFAPQFEQTPYSCSVDENVDAGVGCVTVIASDSDGTGGTLTLELYGQYSSLFAIEADSNRIMTDATFDREELGAYEIYVRATDSGTPARESSATISIEISDVNDQSPVFAPREYTVELSEYTEEGTFVKVVTATDADLLAANSEISYGIVSNDGNNGLFNISADTGRVYLVGELDFETAAEYGLTVSATDPGGNSDTTSFLVTIADENDNAPAWTEGNEMSFFISDEIQIGHSVGLVQATDPDSGRNGTVGYRMVEERDFRRFAVHPVTGFISVTQEFNAENDPSSFRFDIQAFDDGATPLLSELVEVTVTLVSAEDLELQFERETYFVTLDEDLAINGSVVDVLATNRLYQVPASLITYTITGGNIGSTFNVGNGFRGIDRSGHVTLAAAMDYETIQSYQATVTASFAGDTLRNGTTIVRVTVADVNDHTPVFDATTVSATVVENSDIGTSVARVTASDGDLGDVFGGLTYRLVSGADAKFALNAANEGLVVLAGELDREFRDSYNLTIRASDGGVGSNRRFADAHVIVTVGDYNDNRPVFSTGDDGYICTIPERTDGISCVGDLLAGVVTDADQANVDNSRITYRLLNGLNVFEIDSSSGVITSTDHLDYGLHQGLTLVVVASDNGVPQLSAFSSVNVSVLDRNDQSPTFSHGDLSFSTMENLNPQRLGQVSATDGDLDGPNSLVFYTLLTDTGQFRVNRSSGEIWTVGGENALDREVEAGFVLTIRANDSGVPSLSNDVTIFVTVTDANDNPPIFPDTEYTCLMFLEDQVGSECATVVATDLDNGVNGSVYYATVPSSGWDYFGLDANSGTIAMDNDNGLPANTASITLQVRALDRGTPQQTSDPVSVVVTILETNGEPPGPSFDNTVIRLNLPENTAANTPLVQLSASDETDAMSALSFAMLTSGSIRNLFTISDSGLLATAGDGLDREASQTVYSFQAQVTDRGNPPNQGPLTGYTRIIVTVTGLNDIAPVFGAPLYTAAFAEGYTGDVVTVAATDGDIPDASGDITFAIQSGARTGLSVDAASGVLSTSSAFNYEVEAERYYTVVIRAEDNGDPNLAADISVVITTTDINDNSPVVTNPTALNISIFENASVNDYVVRVDATDEDSGVNGVRFFEILSGNEAGLFAIGEDSGIILTASEDEFDAESSTTVYNLTVRVYNMVDSERLNGDTVFVTVYVEDANDHVPECEPGLILFNIDEDTAIGTSLPGSIRFACSDDDVDAAHQVLDFVFVDDATQNLFSITGSSPVCNEDDVDFAGNEVNIIAQGSDDTNVCRASCQQQTGCAFWTLFDGACYLRSSDAGRRALSASVSGPAYCIDITTAAVFDFEVENLYNFTVRASDVSLSTTFDVSVAIIDVNDNEPTFNQESYAFAVAEDHVVGVPIGQVSASDLDEAGDGAIRFAISQQPSGGRFAVNATSGVLSSLQAFDFEAAQTFVVELSATDEEGTGSTVTVEATVTVSNVNDVAPTFEASIYTVTLPENISRGTLLVTVAASDGDRGTTEIEYSIVAGDDDGTFRINPAYGRIVLVGSFDFETIPSYTLLVNASDQGDPELTAQTTVRFTITDVNDNPPVMSSTRVDARIEQVLQAGVPVTTFDATDGDSGDNGVVRFRIVPRHPATENTPYFSITDYNNGTAALFTNQGTCNIDLGTTLGLRVEAYDVGETGQPSLSSTADVNVALTESNPHSPSWTAETFSARITEQAQVNFLVVVANATDLDCGDQDQLVYTLVNQAPAEPEGMFVMDAATGAITVAGDVPNSTPRSYTLGVQVSDGQDSTASTFVYISIVDTNDNPPVFAQAQYSAAIPEMETGLGVVTVSATDADEGQNANVTYSFQGGGQTSGPFAINATSGAVTTSDAVCEADTPRFLLAVVAADQGVPAREAAAYISVNLTDVNTNAPVFNANSYSGTLAENAGADVPVVTVQATDADCGDTAKITFAIFQGQDRFAVDDTTGEITLINGGLDYEAATSITLAIRASDNFPGSPRTSVVIVTVAVTDINDVRPTFDQTEYTATLDEGSVLDRAVATVAATDPDSGTGGTVTYQMVSGDTSFFNLNANTGVVTTKVVLCEPERDELEITVRASDGGGLVAAADATVTLTVRNTNIYAPVINSPTTTVFELDEDTSTNTLLTTVQATDQDCNDDALITYSILRGDTSPSSFVIDSTTGAIRTGLTALNREVVSFISLVVRASDNGSPTRTDTVRINVTILDTNDNPPVFTESNYAFSVPEDTAAGTVVGTIASTDADAGANAEVTYSLLDDSGDYFTLNTASGAVTLSSTLCSDTVPEVEFRVRATDGGNPALTADATITITTVGQNNHAPVFANSAISLSLLEGLDNGTLIATVSATDADCLDTPKLRYSIVGNSTDFAVHPTSGQVTTNGTFDREGQSFYSVLVTVTDNEDPIPRTSRMQIEIVILDRNDNRPAFDQLLFVATLPEDSPAGTAAAVVRASDVDYSENGTVSYSLLTTTNRFEINSTTGVILTTDTFDYDNGDRVFHLRVNAVDLGTPALAVAVAATVRVIITDRNDNTPEFEAAEYTGTVTENYDEDADVVVVQATDGDSGFSGVLRYSIRSEGNPGGIFVVNAESGQVSTNVSARDCTQSECFDREDVTSYVLVLVATDQGENQQETTTRVVVTVLDSNDHSPVFQDSSYGASIAENEADAALFTVRATDTDVGENAAINFAIATSGVPFAINETSGAVTTSEGLDRETQDTYNFQIRAFNPNFPDNPGVRVNATVAVTDENDSPPVFTDGDTYLVQINESYPRGHTVLTLAVSDDDLPPNSGSYTFSIVGGNGGGFWQMTEGGDLRVSRQLDYETQTQFELTIRVADQGTIALAATATIIITLTDDNDNTPTFNSTEYATTIPEDTAVGAELLQVFATEEDEGGDAAIRYSIFRGATDLFSINSATGIVSLAGSLDYDAPTFGRSYTLVVRATDVGSLNGTCEVRISVTDVNDNTPEFDPTVYTTAVTENANAGLIVALLSGTDIDSGANQAIQYVLLEPANPPFEITEDGEVRLTGSLDRETQDSYMLIASIRDQGSPQRVGGNATVNITVLDQNDNDPQFSVSDAVVSVDRAVEAGTVAYTAEANDTDAGLNAELAFSIFVQTVENAFSIDRDSGEVSLANTLCAEGILDADSTTITIRVSDKAQSVRSSIMQLVVEFTDANVHLPIFEQDLYTFTIIAGAAAATEIITVTATEDSECRPGDITYSIRSGNLGSSFRIDASSGEIITAVSSLSRPSDGVYRLVIEADDGGYPGSRNTTTTVHVVVSPVFTGQFRADGTALLRTPILADANYINATFNLGREVDSTGVVTAAWGSLNASSDVSVNQQDPSIVSGLLFDEELWLERRSIRAAIKITDASGRSSWAGRTPVAVRAAPSSTLLAIDGSLISRSCVPDDQSGICYVTLPALPSAYFLDSRIDTSGDHFIDVEVAIQGQDFETLGRLPLQFPQPVPTITSDMALQLPRTPMYAGQAFGGIVYANSTYPITVFTVIIEVDSSVTVNTRQPITYNSTRWSVQLTRNGNRTVVSGTLQTSIRVEAVASPVEELFRVNFATATGEPSTGARGNVNIFIETAEDVRGAVNIRGVVRESGDAAPRGTVDDLRGSRSNSSGQIQIIPEEAVGVLAWVPETQLINLVQLTGNGIEVDIGAVRCFTCPRQNGAGACRASCASFTPSCSISSTNSLQLDGCSVFLDGSEAAAATNVSVTVADSDTSLTDRVDFAVGMATGFSVATERTTLHPVAGWAGGDDCSSQLYQSTGIIVLANVTFSASSTLTFDVTHASRTKLRGRDTRVATVETNRFLPTFTGVGAGSTTIQLVGSSGDTAVVLATSSTVTVSPYPVHVVGGTLYLASDLLLTTPSATHAGDPLSLHAASASVVRSFDVEGREVSYVLKAVTNDSLHIFLTPDMGLTLSSSAETTLQVADDNTGLVVGSLTGRAVVNASWDTCSTHLFDEEFPIDIELAPPTDVIITVGTDRLSPPNDPAARLGLATSTSISVQLVYEDGTRSTVTADDRLSFIVEGADAIAISRDTGRLVARDTDFCGLINISVVFSHLPRNLTAALEGNGQQVKIVCLDDMQLSASPFPTYSGSTQQSELTLSLIGPSNVYQRAVLRLVAGLSDGTSVTVTEHSSTAYQTYDEGTSDVSETIVSIASGSQIVSPQREGFADVGATFAGFPLSTSGRLTFNVTDSQVIVTEITSTRRLGTLRGLAGVATAQMTVTVVMSDSTRLLQLLGPDDTQLYPNLVVFGLNPTQASSASMNQTTGVVTLRSNNNAIIAAVATGGGGSDVSVSETFACNLDPQVGDIDLGNPTGVPFPAVNRGAAVTIPIRVNSGNAFIGPFTIAVQYDPDAFTIVGVIEGTDMAAGGGAGNLLHTVSQSDGRVTITSTGPAAENQRGSNYHLISVQIRASQNAGVYNIGGAVRILVEFDITSGATTIGDPTPRSIGAGAGLFTVNDGRRRSLLPPPRALAPLTTLATPKHARTRSRRAVCAVARPLGDANGDCAFDIIDAAYTSRYVVEALVNFQGDYGSAIREHMDLDEWPDMLGNMDADTNTVVDALDVFYLARTTVGMTHHVRDVQYSPTVADGSGCALTLMANVVAAGRETPDVNKTIVWFDLSSTNQAFRALLRDSSDDCDSCIGSIETDVTHIGANRRLFGGLIRAEFQEESGLYLAAIETDAVEDLIGQIGLSVLVTTADEDGAVGPLRVAFLTGPPRRAQAFLYSDTLSLELPVSEDATETVVKQGFTPHVLVNNTMRSSWCRNDNTPAFEQREYTFTLPESFPVNATIGWINATDDDVGPGAAVTYEVIGATDVPQLFTYDVETSRLWLSAALDRETGANFSIVIEVADGGFPQLSNTTIVYIIVTDVNDNGPRFLEGTGHHTTFTAAATYNNDTAVYTSNIAASTMVDEDEEVLCVNSTDNDVFDSLEYSVVENGLDGQFAFNATTGCFTRTGHTWRTVVTSYSATVAVSDSGSLNASAVVTFVVGNAASFMSLSDQVPRPRSGRFLVSGFGPNFLNSTQTYAAISAPADVVETEVIHLVHEDGVFYDNPEVPIAFRVFNQLSAIPSVRSSVLLRISPSAELVDALAAAQQSSLAVTTSSAVVASGRGLGIVTENVPQAWFEAITEPSAITLSFRRSEDQEGSFANVATTTIYPRTIPAMTRVVVLDMPYGGVALNEVVNVAVKANADYATGSFQLTFTPGPTVDIIGLNVPSKWTTTVRRLGSGNRLLTVIGILRDEGDAAQGQQSGLEVLGTLRVRVRSHPAACSPTTGEGCSSVSCSILSLESIVENNVVSQGTNATYLDRFGRNRMAGKLVVVNDSLAGAFPSISETVLANTALITGEPVSLPFQIHVTTILGRAFRSPQTGEVSCSALQPNLIKATCTSIYVNGTESVELYGQGDVTITASNGHSTNLSAVVWVPVLPMQLSVGVPTLAPIPGFSDLVGGQCAPLFEHTDVSAVARFTADGTNMRQMRATDMVRSHLVSSAPALANVSATGRVTGYSTGDSQDQSTVTVTVQNPVRTDLALGSVDVTVLAESAADVVGLDVVVARELVAEQRTHPWAVDSLQSVTLNHNATLTSVRQGAGVAAFAQFSDGRRMQVLSTDGLDVTIARGYSSVLQINADVPSMVYAAGPGVGKMVSARWRPPGHQFGCSTGEATGLGHANVNVPEPSRIQVIYNEDLRLTAVHDPLVSVGYAAGIPLQVRLLYEVNGDVVQTLDVSTDPRTTYDVSGAAGLFSVCRSPTLEGCRQGNGLVSPVVARTTNVSTAGRGYITVRYAHTDLEVNVSLLVIRTTHVEVKLHPYPEYLPSATWRGTSSRLFNVDTLHSIANPYSGTRVRQRAVAFAYAATSEGDTHVLPRANQRFIAYQPSTTNVDSTTVRVGSSDFVVSTLRTTAQLASTGGSATTEIGITVGSFTGRRATLSVTNTNVTLTALLDEPRIAGQAYGQSSYKVIGTRAQSAGRIVVDGRFSDGAFYQDLLAGPLLPGLISCASSRASTVRCDADGDVFSFSNTHTLVDLALSVRNSQGRATLSVGCNLNPGPGDVDVGSLNGIFPLSATQGDFVVPLRVNVGSAPLGSAGLVVVYDPSMLRLVSVAEGSGWRGGIFEQAENQRGQISIGMSPSISSRVVGTNVELASMRFRVIGSGTTSITGTVSVMATIGTQENLNGVRIGTSLPRAFVAGAIQFQVGSRRARQLLSPWRLGQDGEAHIPDTGLESSMRHRRQAVCGSPPCDDCGSDTINGDTNADCLFDIADVSFVQLYLSEAVDNFVSARGRALAASLLPTQVRALDGNNDTRVDAADARMLARVYIGKLNFIREFSYTPVEDPWSRGEITINITELSADGTAPLGRDTQVFIDLAHQNASSAVHFNAANVTNGLVKVRNKGSGLHGIIAQMVRLGPLYSYGESLARPPECTAPVASTSTATPCTTPANESETSTAVAYRLGPSGLACTEFEYSTCTDGPDPGFADMRTCEEECLAVIKHTLSIRIDLVAPDIGVSFVMASFDSGGSLDGGRSVFLYSAALPAVYPRRLAVQVNTQSTRSGSPAVSVPLLATRGYSPYITLRNSLASNAAVNEYPPTFDGNFSFNVQEDFEPGQYLYQTSAEDPDESPYGWITYHIAHPDAVFNETTGWWRLGAFALDAEEGWIKVVDALDYEIQTSHEFDVAANDHAPPTPRDGFAGFLVNVIDVNDNNPIFTCLEYHSMLCIPGKRTIAIPWDTPDDTSVGQATASDADSGLNAQFAWTMDTTGQNTGSFFSVNANTGAILKNRGFQRAEGAIFNLRVQVQDRGSPALPGWVPGCSSDDGTANSEPWCRFTNVSVALISDEHLITALTVMSYDDFMAAWSNETGYHRCVDDWSSMLGVPGNVFLHEVVASKTGNAELTIYAARADGETVYSAAQLIELLIARVGQMSQLGECMFTQIQDHRVDRAHIGSARFYSDPDCTSSLSPTFPTHTDFSGACLNNYEGVVSARVYCNRVSLGHVGIRAYGNVGCNMPTLSPNESTHEFATANAAAIGNWHSACEAIEIPEADGVRVVYVTAACTLPTTEGPDATALDGDADGTETTPVVGTTAGPDVDLGAAEGGDDDLGLILGFSLGAICIWILLIAMLLRYYKQHQKLQRAKLMVIAHQGDIAFGTPEPMTKAGNEFSGGEIDPLTGKVTFFKEGSGELEAMNMGIDARMMPSLWATRNNPLMDNNSDDDDQDSLGNLSDFEDADFEAFADSLLDDTMEDELFGYNRGPAGGPGAFGAGPPMADYETDDSLSDFENEPQSPGAGGYLRMGVDSERDSIMDSVDSDIDIMMSPAAALFGSATSAPHTTLGRPHNNSLHAAELHASANRLSTAVDLTNAPSSIGSDGDSLFGDDDDQAVVMMPTYESVGQQWQTRGGM